MTGGSGSGRRESLDTVVVEVDEVDMLDASLDKGGAIAGLDVLEGGGIPICRGSWRCPVFCGCCSSVVFEGLETSCSCLDSPSLLVDEWGCSIEPPIPRSGPIVKSAVIRVLPQMP